MSVYNSSISENIVNGPSEGQTSDSSVIEDEILIQKSVYEEQKLQDDQLTLEQVGFDVNDLHLLVDLLVKEVWRDFLTVDVLYIS